MQFQRYLDPFEESYIYDYTADIADYEGVIDLDALSQSFKILCGKYPVLRGQIVRETNRYGVYTATSGCPGIIDVSGGEEELRKVAHEIRRKKQDVCRLILVRQEGKGLVALYVNHAIFDYTAFAPVFNDLWNIYTSTVEGTPVTWEAHDFPTSALSLIRRRWNQRGSEFSPDTANDAERDVTTYSVKTLQLSRRATTSVVNTAHAYKTSVHGLIAGAVVTASVTDATSICCLSVVDLRKRLEPPVRATETTVLLGIHSAVLEVDPTSNWIAIGTQLKKHLEDSLAARDISIAGNEVHHDQGAVSTERLVISNWGVLPQLRCPATARIVDRGREIAEGSETVSKFPIYGARTYGGRLKIACCYPAAHFSGGDLSRICDGISARLLSCDS